MIFELADDLIEGIRADSTLVDYCTSTFGSQPNFYLGLDVEKSPKNSELPLIVVMPANSNDDSVVDNYTFSLGVAVSDGTITSQYNDSYKSYDGYKLASEFFKQVFDAIQRFYDASTGDKDGSLTSWETFQYDLFYPVFHVSTTITITRQTSDF